ncbi:MAG TPA: hypothetical protein PLL71_17285 [Agriterribacter sp.]|nr:hypothetical protein [Agriterribacter sp.]HRQ51555.1 hypothetical protein [Agriterribacter sp.]
MKAFGIVLIVAGILMLIFRGFSFTKEKNMIDAGPVQLNIKEKKKVSWPIYAGAVAVAAGVVVLVANRKKVS